MDTPKVKFWHVHYEKRARAIWGDKARRKLEMFCYSCCPHPCPGWYWRYSACDLLDKFLNLATYPKRKPGVKPLPAPCLEKFSMMVKARANFRCEQCGSAFNVEAHDSTGRHIDPNDGIALCSYCHAARHPDVPRALFFSPSKWRCWQNISAAEIAHHVGCSSRTVIRCAQKLGIIMGGYLPSDSLNRIMDQLGDYKFFRQQ